MPAKRSATKEFVKHHRDGTVGAKGQTRRRSAKATDTDSYLAALPRDQRSALEKLRKTIRAAAPKAEECISYQLPAFKLGGKPLAAFGASANHCSFYPMSGSTLQAFGEELEGYHVSKGTIRFPAAKPLPVSLVRKLVKARMAEIGA